MNFSVLIVPYSTLQCPTVPYIAPYGHPFTEDYPYQKNVGFCCILTLISGRGLVGDYLAVI